MNVIGSQGAGPRALRAAGVAGLIFFGLMTFSLLVIRAYPPSLSGDQAGTIDVDRLWLLATYLIPFAGMAFLWFLAVLRRRIGSSEDQFFATVFLGSGLLFIAMLFAADAVATAGHLAAVSLGAAASDHVLAFAKALSETLFYLFATKMAAVFMLVSSTIARRTGFIPRWFIAVSMIGAIVMLLSVSILESLALIFPVWVAIVSIFLIRADADAWQLVTSGRDAGAAPD